MSTDQPLVKRQLKRIFELREQRDDCIRALHEIDMALRVPAAEYVPAIGDAFKIIDGVFARAGIKRQP